MPEKQWSAEETRAFIGEHVSRHQNEGWSWPEAVAMATDAARRRGMDPAAIAEVEARAKEGAGQGKEVGA